MSTLIYEITCCFPSPWKRKIRKMRSTLELSIYKYWLYYLCTLPSQQNRSHNTSNFHSSRGKFSLQENILSHPYNHSTYISFIFSLHAKLMNPRRYLISDMHITSCRSVGESWASICPNINIFPHVIFYEFQLSL